MLSTMANVTWGDARGSKHYVQRPHLGPYLFSTRVSWRFFYSQSSGRFELYTDVVGVDLDPAINYSTPTGRLDWGKVSRDAILEAGNLKNFGDYDRNGDGFVDYVFIFLRDLSTPSITLNPPISWRN